MLTSITPFDRVPYEPAIAIGAMQAVKDARDMEEHCVTCDNEPDLSFRGRLLARVSTRQGDEPQWTELELYITESGRHVCHKIGRSEKAGQRDFHSCAVCDDSDAIVKFFGFGYASKELYRKADIDASTRI